MAILRITVGKVGNSIKHFHVMSTEKQENRKLHIKSIKQYYVMFELSIGLLVSFFKTLEQLGRVRVQLLHMLVAMQKFEVFENVANSMKTDSIVSIQSVKGNSLNKNCLHLQFLDFSIYSCFAYVKCGVYFR